jgi:hypothetical protein
MAIAIYDEAIALFVKKFTKSSEVEHDNEPGRIECEVDLL